VPIKDGERVVAGINVESDRPYAFDEADVAALEALADELAVALRNAQLFEETRQKSEHLAVINRLDRVISSSLQINEVYEVFVEEVAKLISFDRTSIALLDETGEHWEVTALWTRAEPYLRIGARRPVKDTLMEVLLAEWQPWIEGDVGEKGEWLENEILRREGVRSRLLLPLIAKGRMLGMLNFGSYQPHTYSERDLAVLEPIADQMAIALENSRLYQAMGRRLAELGALFEVSGALSGAATAEEMLPVILEKTLEVVAAESGAIFLVDQATGEMVVPVAQGPMEAVLVGRRFPLASTVAEAMLHTGEPAVSPDVATDHPRMPEKMRAMLRGGESGVSLPLRAAGVPVGVMAVSWLGHHTMTDDELRLLTAIADMAAGAIHRASLHDKTVGQAQELERLVAELENTYDATLTALSAALDARDHETEGHSRRVMQLAVTIARAMGLPESEIEALMRGALLHDIGKIGVPDRILSKPGSLTDEERAEMQRHNQIGYDMLRDIEFLAPTLPVVLCHHERWDGRGYPEGLRGVDIPLIVRIFAVADAYDAMTSNRPYRRAMSHAEAVAEIQREAGKQFDPQVVEVFLQVLRSANGQV
ncbi:MAG: GAF domain-containing protein, partial [Anaerolineae bacterium]